ncbi:hypothetical protein [Alkalihalobacterium chitinilyticum]|uniref:Lipoprotein n=1 Tax=Alkalihalobacterium chitinilyticum TaxID=2980103 RepID=A0ABT5VFG0_9BACI|nr:hypothetical protein [Alkalihalobacterium chitinilyticum]MDE5414015.1 hypothetical protein [Alkalihalobacterium chitinilyticum]
MKLSIMMSSLILGFLLLTGCQSDDQAASLSTEEKEQVEQEKQAEEAEVEPEENTAKNEPHANVETESLDVLGANSRFALSMRDDHNETYQIHIYAEDEQRGTLDAPSFQGSEGDIFYSGFYNLYVSEDGSDYGVKQEHLSLFYTEEGFSQTFNEGVEMAYISSHPDGRDILVLYQREATNVNSVHLFTIQNGQLQSVTPTDHWISLFGGQFKNIGDGRFQTVDYLNHETDIGHGWVFNTWELEGETLALNLIDQKVYNDGTYYDGFNFGQDLYHQWNSDTSFHFPYAFIPVTREWLTLAEQGLLPTAKFPLGTSYETIVAEKGEPIESNDMIGGVATHFFNHVGYSTYFTGEDDVIVLVLRGELIAGDVNTLIDTLGQPDRQMIDERYIDTELLFYETGIYELAIEIRNSDEIFTVTLSSR